MYERSESRPARSPWRRADASTAAWVALACLAGCAPVPTAEKPGAESPTYPNLELIELSEVVLVRPTAEGGDALLGYLEERADRADARIFFVFDEYYARQLGCFFDSGVTYRYTRKGEREPLGNHDWERSCCMIYGVEGELQLRKPPPPK